MIGRGGTRRTRPRLWARPQRREKWRPPGGGECQLAGHVWCAPGSWGCAQAVPGTAVAQGNWRAEARNATRRHRDAMVVREPRWGRGKYTAGQFSGSLRPPAPGRSRRKASRGRLIAFVCRRTRASKLHSQTNTCTPCCTQIRVRDNAMMFGSAREADPTPAWLRQRTIWAVRTHPAIKRLPQRARVSRSASRLRRRRCVGLSSSCAAERLGRARVKPRTTEHARARARNVRRGAGPRVPCHAKAETAFGFGVNLIDLRSEFARLAPTEQCSAFEGNQMPAAQTVAKQAR